MIAVAGDDAELLALKAKFDPVFATWVKIKIAERENHESLAQELLASGLARFARCARARSTPRRA